MNWELFESEFPKPAAKPSTLNKCVLCEGEVRLSEDGFLTCANKKCSVVHMNAIDLSAEWRFYGEDSYSANPIRCGMPINPLLPESSIGCKVMCTGNASYAMRKIARYTEWHSMPYKEKARYDEFQRIILMANNAGIPKMIVDEACKNYKIISEKQSFRGLNAMSIINELEISVPVESQTKYATTNPHSFIERYCSKLSMNTELTKLAQFIAIQIEKNNLIPENTPQSVAAGIMFFMAREFNLNISEKDIQQISDTSSVTINKCCRKMDSVKSQLIPSSIYVKYKSFSS